ncbi:hypothetical protein R9C00_25785 [Flammeovirgaceae bacterium SG7u.111]|nr:hypothetical protein [Flammeovirgaceae bacterium SG7u.132]WPO35109.1 hypothetical protein R9C00_25785 [Flammeovirgaceae bacterium SG7u.111]
MKKIYTVLAILTLFVTAETNAQSGQVYTTSGGEMIFSFAQIDNNGNEKGNIMRFSPVFNLQNMVNYDMSPNFGVYSGLAVRNVGFIYKDPNTDIKKKYRNYNLGIPFGVKFGNLDGLFLYGGYELEIPFNYKEKTFEGERKTDKFNVWFSKRTPSIYNTVVLGVQFPYGANLKFKYYLTNFFNKDYSEMQNGVSVKPFENFDANVFYFALSFKLFRNTEIYYKDMRD